MRQFAEINGNWTNADNVCAYCLYHKGMLTEGLIHTHGCLTKNNGERCARMLQFEIRPTTQREKKPTGDEYRLSLKKKRKKRK